ncbi:MAG TPA: alanine--tRNA ligase [Caulobacteraceae bacterium]|jgi:alanyl-tRNA synthetase
MPSLNDVRSLFLSYFGGNDHAVVASAPLVPQNDPSLLFVNAGMVPFKNIFTGAETPPAPRAASSQKSVRAGGKHNDLDNVGYTARHHTFFEMLGNFSFGDYFKEEAIELAWRLLSKELKLDTSRLLITVHSTDEEAAALWRKIAGFPDDKIIRINSSDNFWSMGDTGPCGPCSEIFYDHGSHIPGGPPGSPDEDGDRFVEIWNLVFMQYEQHADGRRSDLPKPSIDTGMGIERLAAVLQGVHDNYDIDLFRKLIAASKDLTGGAPTNGPSHRVIADHLRSSSFLIADGVSPSNEGRGYVLRRIMRRAMRHAHLLGAAEPLMHRLVPTLVEEMGGAYPELRRAEPVIVETLRQEEERFRRTLGRGMTLLDEATAGLGDGDVLPGRTAFRLYDTYGFPLDLTQDALRAKGISVDLEGFDAAMAEQKEKGRENWGGSGQAAQGAVWFSLRDTLGPTIFTGYDEIEGTGELLALVQGGADVTSAAPGDEVEALFDRTPFYAESGGQAGDRGEITWDGGRAVVTDTQKQAGDLHVHVLKVLDGELTPGMRAHLMVDPERRARTRLNHSAAHLAHAALGHVLGPHVAQKGQLVDGDRMRFDFSHGAPLTPDEIDRIETEVNAVIRQNLPALTQEMAPQAAIEAGAVALFGEKYGDKVRVLTLGRALGDDDAAYSVELCGGTHVARTGDIALFKIVAEQGIAAGVRRIEALTGEPARRWLLEQAGIAKGLAEQFKVPVADVPARVDALQAQARKLERELGDAKRQLAVGGGSGGGGAAQIEEVGGVKFIGRVLDGVGGKDLRPIAETFRKQLPDGVIVLNGVLDGKVANTVVVTGSAQAKFSAVDLARIAVAAMGGQGAGGKPDFAQGGAPDGAKAADGVAAVKAALAA